MINKETFREFHDDEEASEWAIDNFAQWINDIKSAGDNSDENSIANLLYEYAGNMSIIYNRLLRGIKGFDESDDEEYYKNITSIVNEINKYRLEENITVYRFTDRRLFGFLFKTNKPKEREVFIDKGFMSMTLVPEMLRKFAKENKYNCVLKLYLPKGTKGVYLKFDKSILNEHEFLLPPNSTFRLLKKHLSFKYFMVYEGELIGQ